MEPENGKAAGIWSNYHRYTSRRVSVGMAVTGANQEQIAAFKRSFAKPWEKTATLLPVSTDDEGNIKRYYCLIQCLTII